MKECFDTICSAIDNARVELEDMESELFYFQQEVERLLGKVKKLDSERERLEAENVNLKQQKNFLLMHGVPPTCLLCVDCSYLTQLSRPLNEPCDWRCTANLEMRTRCLEKAVERIYSKTTKTANVDAEQANKE